MNDAGEKIDRVWVGEGGRERDTLCVCINFNVLNDCESFADRMMKLRSMTHISSDEI